jgi:hypothetical protein
MPDGRWPFCLPGDGIRAVRSGSMPGIVQKVVIALTAVVGVVWLGQGVGLIPGSFMTGRAGWALAGAGMLVISYLMWRWSRRSPGR